VSAARGQFSSRTGFVLAAAGSAVGLGNVWGFPTQVVSNGGGAFVVTYFVLAFCLAYPALMAELTIGRFAGSNVVSALQTLSKGRAGSLSAYVIGVASSVVSSLILSFYAVVAGWLLAFLADAVIVSGSGNSSMNWFTTDSIGRNLIFTALFYGLTILVVAKGVEGGIERWSKILMPLLLGLMIAMTAYVLTLDGATEGVRAYLTPDFTQMGNPALILAAMGQAFFSLSLGVGAMLIYGSYLSKEENLPAAGALVTLADCSIAFLAGLLIVPAIYVAQHSGLTVFTADGSLIAGPDIAFSVFPPLFDSMGGMGLLIGFAFFALMSIAGLTSAISMLEVPVSLLIEKKSVKRPIAAMVAGCTVFLISALIIFQMDWLFDFVITLTTRYSVPLISAGFCVFATWLWSRNSLLKEIQQGYPDAESSFFWKIWPWYAKFVCPVLIAAVFIQSVLG
jgi:NSS family neurotransmitter:Na+ symporter